MRSTHAYTPLTTSYYKLKSHTCSTRWGNLMLVQYKKTVVQDTRGSSDAVSDAGRVAASTHNSKDKRHAMLCACQRATHHTPSLHHTPQGRPLNTLLLLL